MKRGNRLHHAALVLALLVLAAMVTGVAVSAADTVVPKRLTGDWSRNQDLTIHVSPRGKVEWSSFFLQHARFSRVTAHRLNISRYSCARTGTYRWTITTRVLDPGIVVEQDLSLKKIHDTCTDRVRMFAGRWYRYRWYKR